LKSRRSPSMSLPKAGVRTACGACRIVIPRRVEGGGRHTFPRSVVGQLSPVRPPQPPSSSWFEPPRVPRHRALAKGTCAKPDRGGPCTKPQLRRHRGHLCICAALKKAASGLRRGKSSCTLSSIGPPCRVVLTRASIGPVSLHGAPAIFRARHFSRRPRLFSYRTGLSPRTWTFLLRGRWHPRPGLQER